MADTIEKIYCTDSRDNDLAAILAATKNNDPATMITTKAGNIVLSTSSEALIKEVNAICNDAKEKLANRDYYQMVVDKTPELLVTLNPALKKEQETETRLKAVEGSVQEVKDLVKTLVEKLS